MVIWKTLWLIMAIMGISSYTNNNDLSMLFVGLFACFMYNIWCWLEKLPELDKSS